MNAYQPDAWSVELAARTAFGETCDYSREVEGAVLWTIWNRLRLGTYGSTLAEVCFSPGAYMCWEAAASVRSKLLSLPISHAGLIRLRILAQEIGHFPLCDDPTQGATHYTNDKFIPGWAMFATPTAKISKFEFFKNVQLPS